MHFCLGPTFGTDLKKYNCNNGKFAHKWKNSPVKEVIKQYKSYKITLFQTPQLHLWKGTVKSLRCKIGRKRQLLFF